LVFGFAKKKQSRRRSSSKKKDSEAADVFFEGNYLVYKAHNLKL